MSRNNPRSSSTSLNISREQVHSNADSSLLNDDEEQVSHPVQIRHQGRVSTIFVKENEPILQALERQSTFSRKSNRVKKTLEEKGGNIESVEENSPLALAHIPHECRRGNCLTCSSRVETTSNTQNILANVDNGLSPTIESELAKSGYILTCCSFVTGPGVVLELDTNDQVWDLVYRKRICNSESKQLAVEAQARLLRRVGEENVGKWKMQMEENWQSQDDAE